MSAPDVEKDSFTIHKLEQITSNVSANSEKINDARIHAFTAEEQKNIVRRIDRRLVLTLGFMYCVSLMDRVSLTACPSFTILS